MCCGNVGATRGDAENENFKKERSCGRSDGAMGAVILIEWVMSGETGPLVYEAWLRLGILLV